MRADDAADAITDLPQPRRQPVLDLLPATHRAKILILLGYQTATAGGLMGVDYLALPSHTTAAEALDAVRQANTAQPEALTTIYCTDDSARLVGSASLVRLVQTDADTTLAQASDPDPARIRPHADLIEVATLMADYNLLTLPVVDDADRIVGLITVDDILEAAIPDNWRRREAPSPDRPSGPDHATN
jgi:Mg/Co/Ni transporter MgtE